ncbi:MBL fold metallo-hydrolase [Arthrobacter sp. 31Y]|uniref:MBL fold metallo-hydrolase n=1 Tax=Arthrobacter sp. 31Y TaxID=1115632 RepID=UPI00163A037E|nr:MBL fold metallo-hydrolase [Arthrobacter sp. 31Y]
MPAGVAGPTEISFDVRCFLLPVADGIVVIDTGMGGNATDIHPALERLGAGWADISDVVITHAHADHVGSLNEVLSKAGNAVVWAGEADANAVSSGISSGTASSEAQVRAAVDGAYLRGLRVIHTPGHTPGHISLLHEGEGLLFTGDAVGTMNGVMVRPPAPFTADPVEAELSLRKLARLSPHRMLFSHGAEIPDASSQLRKLIERSEPQQ